MKDRDVFLTRHSYKPEKGESDSDKYAGLSEKGVSEARKSAKDVLKYIEKTPDGAVVYLGGASDAIRTKSTARIYGEELKDMLKSKGDEYVVIAEEDIDASRGYRNAVRGIRDIVDRNPNKKIIIDVPLNIKQFSIQSRWFTKDGKPSDYLTKVITKHKGNLDESMREWLSGEGKYEGSKGPNPTEVAKSYQKGVDRLSKFIQKNIGKNRPYVIGLVGHSFDADAYLTYLAGDGKVDFQTYEKISKSKGLIKEAELASVNIKPDLTTIEYRGEKHKGRKSLEKILGVFAIVGFFSVLSFSLSNITGNAIVDLSINTTSWLGGVLLVIGLVAGFFWIKSRKR